MNKQSIALILVFVLVIIFIPLPFNEELDAYENVGYIEGTKEWKFVRVNEGKFSSMYGQNFPVFYVGTQAWGPNGYMRIITTQDSESYIEAAFVVPKRGTVFAYDQPSGSSVRYYIELTDSNDITRPINPLPGLARDKTTMYDISPYVGQEVTIRIRQSTDLASKHWTYGNMRVINKPYTLWDNFNIFRNILISVLLISILIGFFIGVSGLEFFNRSINWIEMHIHENKTSGMGFDNKYIRRFLKMSFYVLDVPMCAADKIGDVRVRNWIKITSVLFLSFTIIYITYILAYIFVMVVLALITLAIIIWIIISLLGGSPSGGSIGGGGGSSSGSGGGSSSSSSSNLALSNEKKDNNYQPFFGQEIISDIISPGEKCSNCEGSGKCPNCYGTGNPDVITDIARSLSPIYTEKQKCDECKGSGKCVVCYGKGYLK